MTQNRLDTYYKRPCATCGHRNLHGDVSGCIAVTSEHGERTTWCDCEVYADPSPRNRAADRRAGVAAGREGADAALNSYAVTSATADQWRVNAEARMEDLIAGGRVFTSEDVVDVVGPAPSRNAIGGLFLAYKGRLAQVGWTTATRPEARGRALRQWEGRA